MMRKILIGILLAGAAAARAIAQDNGQGRPHYDKQQGSRGDAHQQREQAPPPQQQPGRGPRFDGGNFSREQAPQFVRQQQVQVQQGPRGSWQQQPQVQPGQRGGWQQQPQVQQGLRGGWQRGYNGGAPTAERRQDVQQQAYGYRGAVQGDRNFGYRQGGSVQQQYRNGSRYAEGGWNRDWRNDRRYDWRRYRDSHRSLFRVGVYIDPFGYGYQPFSIGYQLPPVYFGQRYWIDPEMYYLPYPPPGTAWVRYWNDALLVDVYTGQIVDAIQGFFW